MAEPFLDALRIAALGNDEVRACAARVDAAAHDEPQGVITLPEIRWAQANMHDEVEQVAFQRLVGLFEGGVDLLGLVGRPALRLAGREYPVVLEIPKDVTNDALLAITEPTGLDLIIIEGEGIRYVAVNPRGRLQRVVKGMRGVLTTDRYDEVRVTHVVDVNNGFLEGASLIPRRVWGLVGDTFGSALDSNLEATVADNVGQLVGRPPKKGNEVNVGIVTAGLMGLGTIGLGAALATAPMAAYVLLAVIASGSLYNGLRGALRRPDLYFVLNIAGVQLAQSHRLTPEALRGL